MPDPKQAFIDAHIRRPEILTAYPNYKVRLHAVQRMYEQTLGTKDAPAPEDAAASEEQPEPGPNDTDGDVELIEDEEYRSTGE